MLGSRTRVVYAAVALTIGCASPSVAATAQDSSWAAAMARFAQQIAADVEQDGVGGITAGVFVGSDVVWAQGFGWADRDRRIPADVETIYRTGSISKSFTAVAMAQFAAEAKFHLDDPVATVFPEIAGLSGADAGYTEAITFRRLASHTAGLVREPELPNAAAGPIAEWENKILASIPTTGFLARPGERYAYSNIGFGMLGLAISRAVGRPFMQLVEENILAPLGMDQTVFIMTPELHPHLSVGYEVRRDGTVDPGPPAYEHWGRGYKVPNGGIYSTVGDLARFAGGVMGTSATEILSPEWRAEVMRMQTPESDTSGYGLGFMIRTNGGVRTVGHSGSVAGYNAYLVFDPESTVGVVLLRNYVRRDRSLGPRANALLRELVAAYTAPRP